MKKLILIFSFVLLSVMTIAQTNTKRQKELNLENKIAIQGYDPVSYFIQKKPTKGRSNLAAIYEGVTFYFSSQSNKDVFIKNPANFEPQYGGWCAYAMGSTAEKVEINPETFKIIDGKLYLFYNAYFNNTLKSWNKNEVDLKKKADSNWKKLIN